MSHSVQELRSHLSANFLSALYIGLILYLRYLKTNILYKYIAELAKLDDVIAFEMN